MVLWIFAAFLTFIVMCLLSGIFEGISNGDLRTVGAYSTIMPMVACLLYIVLVRVS